MWATISIFCMIICVDDITYSRDSLTIQNFGIS